MSLVAIGVLTALGSWLFAVRRGLRRFRLWARSGGPHRVIGGAGPVAQGFCFRFGGGPTPTWLLQPPRGTIRAGSAAQPVNRPGRVLGVDPAAPGRRRSCSRRRIRRSRGTDPHTSTPGQMPSGFLTSSDSVRDTTWYARRTLRLTLRVPDGRPSRVAHSGSRPPRIANTGQGESPALGREARRLGCPWEPRWRRPDPAPVVLLRQRPTGAVSVARRS